MANKRIKLTIVDSDGDENEIFPETDMHSVIGLEAELKDILNRLNKLDKKGTKL
mgnify:CR=1 FL=1